MTSTNHKQLVSGKRPLRMPITRSTIRVEDFSPPKIAEIHRRILEGGRQIELLIGRDFPVVGNVLPVVDQFNRMIGDYGLKDTWVIMITPEDREVSNFAMAFLLVFFAITDSLFGRSYCRQLLTVL